MSDTFQTGKTFVTGEQVTATDLNNAVNQATPKVPLTDDQSITVVNNKLTVKDGTSTNGVPLTKLKHIIGHSVIGNAGSATAAPTNIEVAANEAVLGNSAGNGLITDKIDTNNIKDDAITLAKTSFIADSTATMTLTGTAPIIILDDNGNAGESPELNGNSVEGSLSILATKSGADITIDADDNLMLKHNGTEGLRVSADAATDASGNPNQPGVLVTGDLQVTADINVGGAAKVAGDVIITDPSPRLTFNDTTTANTDPYIEGSNDGHLVLYTRESGSDINLDPEHEVIMKSNNGSTVVFRASDASSKDAAGNTGQKGIKVEGDIWATSDIRADGVAKIPTIQDNITIQGTSPQITFNDDDNPGTSPRITGNSTNGNLSILAEQSGADILIDANDNVILRNNGSNILATSATAGKDSTGSNASGAQVTGCLEVTQDINCAGGFSDIKLKSVSPKLEFEDTDASVSNSYIQSFNTGNLEIKTEQANSNLELDAKDEVFIKYDNNTVFSAGADEGRNSSDADVPGCKVDGALQVSGEANIGKTKLGADSILASSPSAADNSTKLATTAFVQSVSKSLSSGFTTLATGNTSGTASSDGFIIVTYRASGTGDDGECTVTIGSETFESFSACINDSNSRYLSNS